MHRLLLILILTTLCYLPSLLGPFVWDDYVMVLEDPAVVTLGPLPSYFQSRFWRDQENWNPQAHYYRPLTTLSLALNYAAAGPRPFLFHLFNVSVHLLSVAVLFLLARALALSDNQAGIAAALFALFPRSTESVAWVSGRTDVLAGLFALAAWLAVLRLKKGRYVAAGGLLFLGLLCKEVALCGGVAMLAYAAKESRGQLRGVASAVGASAVAYLALRLSTGTVVSETNVSLWQRLPFSAQALFEYARMLATPWRPNLVIGTLGHLESSKAIAGAIIGVALFATAVIGFIRFSPRVLAAWGIAGTGIFAALHVIPLPVNVVAADRYLYLPMAGFAILVAAALPNKKLWLWGAVVLCLSFASATLYRTLQWGDELVLWKQTVHQAPAFNHTPQASLGNALLRAGKTKDALGWFQKAQKINQEAHRAFGAQLDLRMPANIASCYSELGQLNQARPIYENLIAAQPQAPYHLYNLGLVELRDLKLSVAKVLARKLRATFPDYPRGAPLEEMISQTERRLTALPRPPLSNFDAAQLRAFAALLEEIQSPHLSRVQAQMQRAAP